MNEKLKIRNNTAKKINMITRLIVVLFPTV